MAAGPDVPPSLISVTIMAPRWIRLVDIVVAVEGAVTVLIFLTGGLTIRPLGVRVALTSWPRALVVTTATALLAAMISAWLAKRVAGTCANGASVGPPWADRVVRIALVALSLAGVLYWATYFVAYCGGSDSYGYVSASRALLDGVLIQPQEVASWLPVANPLDVATPAGWVPAADRSGIAPQYPLGLPMLMAVATLIGGRLGPFVVPFACGVVSLGLVHQIARAAYGPRAAWLATTMVSWSPLVVAYAIQPMSDVPATMWVLVAVWALLRPRPHLFVAGIATGVAFLTRPGGLGAYFVIGVAAFVLGGQGRVTRAVRFASGAAPFVLALAVIQWRLFGHPLQSGYGALNTLYGGGSVNENLRIFATAVWQTQTPLWVVAVAASWVGIERTLPRVAMAVLLGSLVPYLLYLPFDHWETLRFLLPGLVLVTIAAAGGVTTLFARIRRPTGLAPALTVAFGVVCVLLYQSYVREQDTPGLRAAEARYPAVAEHLRNTTPPDAVVFAAQHSGSIRYYAPRLTLRWDLLRAEDLRPSIDALRARGHRVYVALEGSEQQRFARDFAEPLRAISRLPMGQVRNIQLWELTPSTSR